METPDVTEGEDGIQTKLSPFEELIKDKKLTFEEASKCLNTLGKDQSGSRYAYLMLTATNMKLTDISIITKFKHLQFVDVSNNYLKLESLQILTEIPYLIYLKAGYNRIESARLKPMYYLQVLDLNKNQITQTFDINQPLLDTLIINYNLIHLIQFDSFNLENLKQLELRGNVIFEISGNYPKSLEKLYLPANKITNINGNDFCKLNQLQILHLRDNNLRKLNGFEKGLINLKYLNLRNNRINKLRQFRKLRCLSKLDTLIILDNPISLQRQKRKGDSGEDEIILGEGGEDKTEIDTTRIPLLVLLPNLKRINKKLVTLKERSTAEENQKEIMEEIMAEISSDEEIEVTITDLSPASTEIDEEDAEDSADKNY